MVDWLPGLALLPGLPPWWTTGFLRTVYLAGKLQHDPAGCIVLSDFSESACRIRGPVDRVMSPVQPIGFLALNL